MSYCSSRFHTVRRRSLEVKVGSVGVGGDNPIRIQSMTTSDTQDVAATVAQAIALAEVGCEIVRVTAPNVAAARCLKEIRERFTAAGFGAVPLVADIHFLPAAAMEAVEHVEKVRVNPGNYADKKKFAVREYTDADYDRELQRLYEAFSPLVLRAKALGRALRIGTNHGSLSDRIMNRYGDTPLGMVESALEFLRIAESHGFNQLILSMKASNPKVMIQAYRLLVERMQQEDMHYPLHLGVTEAGDGEDGRIKSAIGIGSLLLDGLGDTIRVSLTEDSVYEIPVAQTLAAKAMSLWQPAKSVFATPSSQLQTPDSALETIDAIDPFHFTRRAISTLRFTEKIAVGPELPPVVLTRVAAGDLAALRSDATTRRLGDTPAEGLIVPIESASDLETLPDPGDSFYALELGPAVTAPALSECGARLRPGTLLVRTFTAAQAGELTELARFARERGCMLALDAGADAVRALASTLQSLGEERLVFTLSATRSAERRAGSPDPAAAGDGARVSAPAAHSPARAPAGSGDPAPHPLGAYRQLAEALRQIGLQGPIWIRNTSRSAIRNEPSFLSKLLEASILTGALLCDGLGDLVSIETENDPVRATKLAYNVLQGAGARTSKTEFVACPSCGRTLFDLQTTTQRIRAQTGHLKGVKLAIMGCIVNGPGEMADADFGYVGGAPGKINLYVGKQCVAYNIPQAEADARLIALIKEHGKWVDPQPVPV